MKKEIGAAVALCIIILALVICIVYKKPKNQDYYTITIKHGDTILCADSIPIVPLTKP
jgi:hypothetical protein